jgi:hypothetical protein
MCQHNTIKYAPKRCRHCPGCIQSHKNRLTARVTKALSPDTTAAFLTLTSRPDMSWPILMKAFTRYIAWLRKQIPQLEYCAVKEQGAATGMKHLHIVVINWKYIPWADLSAKWLLLSGAWNLNIKPIRTGSPGTYIAKYLGKDILTVRKQVTFSRKFPKLIPLSIWHTIPSLPLSHPDATTYLVTPKAELIQTPYPQCDCVGLSEPCIITPLQWERFYRDLSSVHLGGLLETLLSQRPDSASLRVKEPVQRSGTLQRQFR